MVARLSPALVFVSLAGCVAAPPGPRGPLLGNGTQFSGDFSLAFSAARAEREGGTNVSGTSDHFWSPLAIFPRRLELRMSPVSFLDLGADLGWLDGGADLRVGRWGKPNRVWAAQLALGVRSGSAGPFKDTKSTESAWARLEVYPLVHGANGRLLLSLGANVGRFYHQIEYQSKSDAGESYGPSAIQVVRRELRIESAIGYHTQDARRASILVAIEPYLVADSGAARASACAGCESVDYEQWFGVVLVLRGALHVPFEAGDLD